jgi:hypothetical protein
MPPATLTPITDAAFCAKVIGIAQALDWTLDDMCNPIGGCSFAFDHRDGRRAAGGICGNKQDALVSACKKLLPEIYQYL